MRRRFFAFLLTILLLPAFPVMAEDGHLVMAIAPSQFSQGETAYVYFTVPQAATANLEVLDGSGQVCATLLKDAQVHEGANELPWDGSVEGNMLPAGDYVLRLTMGDRQEEISVTLTAGSGSVAASASLGATLEDVDAPPEESGETTETEESGEAATLITPAYRSTHTPSPKHENCYWCTPMDIRNEAAVWAMLTAPVTVLKGENQKQQEVLRAEPSEDAQGIGVVTCVSQSVHVLETLDNGWSLVETYSSSFYDSKVKAWNLFVTGYVRTNRLTEKRPNQEFGIVIDKLTQELYLFKNGRLFSKLLVSTGLFNEKQPYNETRSGEFLLVSKVGEFRSDNMFASMAMRFNSGDLLHEVPHVKNADGTKNYKNTEFKLGTRASHGCIRVQRLKNDEGVNMSWIWNNVPLGTKMVIWEDFAGRQTAIPDPATMLYYNPDGGTSYHLSAECRGVKEEYLPLPGSFTYGELNDSQYKELKACWYCVPPRRIEEIEEINTLHLTQSPGDIPQHLRQDN